MRNCATIYQHLASLFCVPHTMEPTANHVDLVASTTLYMLYEEEERSSGLNTICSSIAINLRAHQHTYTFPGLGTTTTIYNGTNPLARTNWALLMGFPWPLGHFVPFLLRTQLRLCFRLLSTTTGALATSSLYIYQLQRRHILIEFRLRICILGRQKERAPLCARPNR